MARERVLTVTVAGEDKGAAKTLKALGDEADKLGAKVEHTEKRAGNAFKGVAIAVGGVVASGKLAELSRELGAQSVTLDVFARKSKTVFEGSAGDVDKWASKNAHAMGLTDQELVGLAANFGDLVKPMGFAASEAAEMSKEVVGLSGVLSAWSGNQRSASEVASILTKAMLGERDGLKELGISISEADVSARLLKKGQEDLTGAARQQAEAVATQELIFEKSTDAQKAWGDGSLDAAKKQNRLKAALAELREEVAQRLGPALGMLAPAIETLGPIAAGVGGISQATGMSLGQIAAKTGPVVVGFAAVAAGAAAVVYALKHQNDAATISAQGLTNLSRASTDELVRTFEEARVVLGRWGLDAKPIFRDLAETSYGAAQRAVEGLEAQANKTKEQQATLAAYKTILGEVGAANVRAGEDAKAHATAEDDLTASMEEAKSAADGLKTSFDLLSGKHIDAAKQSIAYESQLANADDDARRERRDARPQHRGRRRERARHARADRASAVAR